MRELMHSLERRCLLSAALPAGLFADTNVTYQLAVDGLPVPLELTSVRWGLTQSGFTTAVAPFEVSVPSGPSSAAIMQLATPGNPVDQLTLTAEAPKGPREVWEMAAPASVSGSNNTRARLTGYEQSMGEDGILYDNLSFIVAYADFTYYDGLSAPVNMTWNFEISSGPPAPSHFDTLYMSTTRDVPGTMEITRGQQPVDSYQFSISGGGGKVVTDGVRYTTVHSVETLPHLGRAVRGMTLDEMVYAHRDEAGQPLLHQRFADVGLVQFEFFDSTLDDAPASNTWHRQPAKVQTVSYTYRRGDIGVASVSGWNFVANTTWDAGSVTAYVAPVPRLLSSPLPDPVFKFTQPVAGLTLGDFVFEGFDPSGLSLTTADGGRSWTINGVEGRQTTDGDYAIKLFAHDSGVHAGGDPLIGSAGMHWTLDTTSPAPTAASFEYLSAQALAVSFSEDVSGSLSVLDLQLENLTNSTTIPNGAMAVVYDHATNTATVTFPGLAKGILPDGNYRALLPAESITDNAGNALTTDVLLDFFVLAGDADRDRDVDFFDFLRLRANYGQTDRLFSDGDFDYDGDVDFFDFLILRGNYGVNLPPPDNGGSLFAGNGEADGGGMRRLVLR